MHIYIGADHRGFALKEKIKVWLTNQGHEVTDCGNTVYDKDDDFPDYSLAVALQVSSTFKGQTFKGVYSNLPQALGIIICGSGGGVTITANKIKGIRCAQGVNVDDVIHNRRHDDINILAIGSDFVAEGEAKSMVEAFLNTPFSGDERFVRRLKKINDIESPGDR